MSAALRFVPARVPLIEPGTGFITREWYLFLQGVFERIGGPLGESTTEIVMSGFADAGIEETKATLYELADRLAVQPPAQITLPDDALQAQIAGLQDRIAELTKDIQALNQATSI
jgi:hypothetical protein